MPWMLVYIAIFAFFSTSNSFSQGAQSKPMHGRQTPSTFTDISSKVCVCIPQVSSVVYFLFAVRKGCQLGLSCNHEYEGEVSKEARNGVTIWIWELHLEPNPHDWADLRHDWQGALYLLLHCHEEKLQANLVQYSAVISLLLSALSVLFRGVLRVLGKHWKEEYPWICAGLVDWKIWFLQNGFTVTCRWHHWKHLHITWWLHILPWFLNSISYVLICIVEYIYFSLDCIPLCICGISSSFDIVSFLHGSPMGWRRRCDARMSQIRGPWLPSISLWHCESYSECGICDPSVNRILWHQYHFEILLRIEEIRLTSNHVLCTKPCIYIYIARRGQTTNFNWLAAKKDFFHQQLFDECSLLEGATVCMGPAVDFPTKSSNAWRIFWVCLQVAVAGNIITSLAICTTCIDRYNIYTYIYNKS